MRKTILASSCFSTTITILSFLALSLSSGSSTGIGVTDEHSRDFLARRGLICSIALSQRVPPELVAGVILAENHLNKNWIDTIQDALFRGILKYHDIDWWSRWAEYSMALTARDQSLRLSTNKWSERVVATGLVFSIGPAQITPRTALTACYNVSNPPALCKKNVKAIIAGLLEYDGAIVLASVILRFEAESHKMNTGKDVSNNLGLWATLYNAGGDYLRHENKDKTSNNFGMWIELNANDIARLLACS
ncbi:MAG: DUF1402 family protein [Alphaproteobacteria bacterium]|nr:DUF1402 family protein [Alphaproteobacteria bacterium]MBM3642291.1 DUF1402 family protein [Alphaproteobacteria bacterium]